MAAPYHARVQKRNEGRKDEPHTDDHISQNGNAEGRTSLPQIPRDLSAGRKKLQDLLQFVAEVPQFRCRFSREGKGGLFLFGLAVVFQLGTRTRDREAILVEQLLDANDVLHISPAVHPLTRAAFHRLELRKLCFPKPKDVSGQATEACDFSDAEVEFVRDNDLLRVP